MRFEADLITVTFRIENHAGLLLETLELHASQLGTLAKVVFVVRGQVLVPGHLVPAGPQAILTTWIEGGGNA